VPYRIVCSGEMADLTRQFRWETTSLGPIESWPDELITTVNLLLASSFPMFLWWGPELIQFYNDAYRPSIREDKHPAALGQRGGECWKEAWTIIGPDIETVVAKGESIWNVNRLVPIFRKGRIEEVFWTYSYSPVRDREGRVEGVLVVCHETTEQVLNERRLRTLLAIDKEGASAQPLDRLGNQLVQTLASNRADIAFALLYCVEQKEVRLVGETGLESRAQAMTDSLPIREVALSKVPKLMEEFGAGAGTLVCEPWPEAIEQVYVQHAGTLPQAQFVLVLGISPRLSFDGNYVSFFQLIGNRICNLLENESHQEERRKAEAQRMQLFETVNRQRDLLANIVESAPAGIAVLDSELRFRWCNPYYVSFLDSRWSTESLIGVKLGDAVPHAEEIIRIFERVRDTHEPFITTEYEHQGFSRGTTYWRWCAVRLATGDILNVSSEVTEQVLARRKLEAVGERLHLAQNAAHLGTYYWHLPSGKVEWSPEFYDAAGIDPEAEASWEFYLSQVHPQDRERLRRELATVAEQGAVLQIHDHRLRGGAGQERWAALSGQIHFDSFGRPERIIGTVADITERKRAEKELEESKKEAQQQWAELEAIYRTAPIGLALFDPVEFRYLRLNSRQAEIVGLPPEEILGKTLTEISPIEGLSEMFEQVAGGKPVINALLEGELPMSPGEHRYWTVNYFPVYNAAGTIQAISAAWLEMTAQKRAELALIQSEKIAAVGRLASSISHEINNPLEAVTNLLYLLKSESLSPDGVEYLAAAERELARVSQIATHTLRFHRQSTKAIETGAAEMIDPILALHLGRISGLAITIEKQYRTEAKVLCFDGEIRQVLNNLIGNAIDAMWGGGRLVLRSQLATDWRNREKGLCITIADTGLGMNEVTKRRLFEAFFTTKGIKGTGLGLWISAEIVRKHGGRLRFRSSRKEGRSGTVFQLFLPLEPAILAVSTQSN
jgi:PAS domain S-box-containing protein